LQTIHPASLTAPQSPILPRTPFVNPSTALSPNTPFTPFIPIATATAASFSPATAQPEILIPEQDAGEPEGAGGDALAGLYNKVLRFVQRDVMGVVRVAESVSAKSRRGQHGYGHGSTLGLGGVSPGGLGTSPGGLGFASIGHLGMGAMGGNGTESMDTEDLERVEIIANVVWAELARALMDELGSVVFAVGRPDEFQQVYLTVFHVSGH
jgi:hypothetical protein